jgi:uncharacterized protein GlcG (DUF336 family)
LIGASLVGAVAFAAPAEPQTLTAADVTRVIGQAVSEAQRVGLPVSIAVLDREGNVLGTHVMAGADQSITIEGGGKDGQGLEGTTLPLPGFPLNAAMLAALSKGGTAAFFSTQGNAFTTRTAGFIIQPHFPPLIRNTSSGPLFGVQFSQLPCGNVIPSPGLTLPPPLPGLPSGTLPLGLSADPGGLPLYKNGHAAGGVGVEGNGRYTVDQNPTDFDVTDEELIAVAATRGYEAPAFIRGDQILVNGIRFPFSNVAQTPVVPPAAVTFGPQDVAPMDTPPSRFVPATLGGVQGTVDPRYFPPRDSIDPPPGPGLTAAQVQRLLTQGARQANRTRAGIRRPLGDVARVNITIVDRAGNVLGIFRTQDAPTFGFDVSAQKGRTAAFFSSKDAGTELGGAGQGAFVDAAHREGVALDGSVAFSDRAGGFLSRPFFPDGIDGTFHGPFSVPIGDFSIFNDGLQLDLVLPALVTLLSGGSVSSCSTIPGIGNGTQIFPGSVPLYRGLTLIGGAGVSGDGVDQDDIISFVASRGFRAPVNIRSDRVKVRDVRLPFVKFPRRPTTR